MKNAVVWEDYSEHYSVKDGSIKGVNAYLESLKRSDSSSLRISHGTR